jgi:hypothetical protein
MISSADFSKEERRPTAHARTINAVDFIRDVRAGMTTSQLMNRYSLSTRECRSLFRQLEAGMKDPGALYGRTVSNGGEGTRRLRDLPRVDIPLPLPVYDAKRPDSRGLVLDVSEKGLRTQGIEAEPGREFTFVVCADRLFDMNPVVCDAECRWVKRKGLHGEYLAGFQITDISERNAEDMHRLIRAVSLAKNQTGPSGVPVVGRSGSSGDAAKKQIWKCPACGMPQMRQYDECPQCGIIVSKYFNQLEKYATEIHSSAGSQKRVNVKISLPLKVWEEAQALGKDPEEVLTNALEFYVKSRKLTKKMSDHVGPPGNARRSLARALS